VVIPVRQQSRFHERSLLLALVVCVLLTSGCTTAKKKKLADNYGPSESIVEVVSVLRRHVPDDTYRFPPATDFTGRNVYRSTLLRLESIERIHVDALRSGYMDPVIEFAKARALERLRAFDLAAAHYRRAAQYNSELRDEAKHSAYVCEQIAEAIAIGIDRDDPLTKSDIDDILARPDPDEVVAQLEERVALLSLLKDEIVGTHYEFVITEEIERADEVRGAYFVHSRFSLPNGQLRAAAELQRVVRRHGPSKRRLRHVLDVAKLFDDMAHEYVEAIPPQSLEFDPASFQELVDPATELYEIVAGHDGRPEKLEAARKLEAFLAFTLVVDRDRFTR
jgi:hypothetical protein